MSRFFFRTVDSENLPFNALTRSVNTESIQSKRQQLSMVLDRFVQSVFCVLRCGGLASTSPSEESLLHNDIDSACECTETTERIATSRPQSAMGVEWSAQNQETLDELDRGLTKVQSEATVVSPGTQLFKFDSTDSSQSSLQWSFVSSNARPHFYNENEDIPTKPVHWRLEIDAGDIDADVAHCLELLGDRSQRRVTFRAGSVWALKFHDAQLYNTFWNDYNNKLFENIYGDVNTQANRETHLGRDFASRLFTEDAEKEQMEWEEAKYDVKKEEATPAKRSKDPVAGKGDISLIKVGIGESSYLVRGDQVNALRNVPCGVEDKRSMFVVRKPDGSVVKPSVVMLADRERKMGMLTPNDDHALLYTDIETGKVVQEWKFEKDETEIPMKQIVPETKNAPAEDRSTFLSFDTNRLCRWDTRDPAGIVQEYSPKLDLLGGKDYSRYTNFTCMATAGDGSVAVGSKDGKVRLYSNKLTLKRASTAFPAIGTPITHVDITYDGKWVIATTEHFIEVLKTTAIGADGKSVNGFQKSLGANASGPKLLKLKPEDAVRLKYAPLKNGRFTFVTEADRQERWIVATCGSSSVLWNFRQVKANTSDHRAQGGMPTFMTYHLVNKDETVVDSCFLHEGPSSTSGNQSEAALVVATPNKVWSFAE